MSKRAIVFGAGGAVGEAISRALLSRGWRVTASMYSERHEVAERLSRDGAEVRRDDLDVEGDWVAVAAASDALIFTTHLALTTYALRRITVTTQRIVAFSSNNVAIHPDSAFYAELADAERSLRARHPGSAIIRPTLIYGDPRLPTLTRVMRMARSWPVLPLPGSGRALLQPVFHEDLGAAAAWLADAQSSGTYAVGGPDSVTMYNLYREIIRAGGAKTRIHRIPAWVLRAAAPVLTGLKLYSKDQISRVDRDRLALVQTPLPAEIVARTSLREGLARLAAALGREELTKSSPAGAAEGRR